MMVGKFSMTLILVGLSMTYCEGKAAFKDSSVSRLQTIIAELVVYGDGTYSVSFGDGIWLNSDDTFFTIGGTTYSRMKGNLIPTLLPVTEGFHEQFGNSQQTILKWQATDPAKTEIVTTFQLFDDFLLFTQDFSNTGLNGTSVGDQEKLCTSFPSFTVDESKMGNLGFMSYGHIFIHDVSISRWQSSGNPVQSGLYGGPLSLFNQSSYTVVLSPLSEFMAASVYYNNKSNSIHQGIMGKIKSIPKNFKVQTILYFGQGIKETWFRWGKALLNNYGTIRKTDEDPSLKYLGYWTDNGAFYYYNMELGKNYEQTMLDIKKYADSNKIPYRYYQIDSWWYYKGLHGGVKNWTAMPMVFPDGLPFLYKNLGYKIAAHNRWWSPNTDYAKQNGGKYNFIVEAEKALPQDKEFWNFLIKSSKDQWGLFLYEQDWLNQQFESMDATLENITVGRTWLMEMGYGVENNGLTMQYCMPMARHLLQSVEIPVVTQARASGDYQPGNNQWDIGMTSVMHHAIGIHPFKDNFWTTKTQPGNVYFASEKRTQLQTIVAVLSTGPVGPSDKINYSNVTLIYRTCNSDGLLLQPSRPAMVIDANINHNAFGGGVGGYIWTTYSNISGHIFGSILVVNADEGTTLSLDDAELGMAGGSYVFADGTTKLQKFNNKDVLKVGPNTPDNFAFYHTSPQIIFKNDTYIMLGETSKIVTASPQRFHSIMVTQKALEVKVDVAKMETVKITFFALRAQKQFDVVCASPKGGIMTAMLTGAGMYTCQH